MAGNLQMDLAVDRDARDAGEGPTTSRGRDAH